LTNIRLIRRRIRSVQSVAKVTRAMEMVATSKMRRAQERGLAGRPYSEKIHQVLADLAALPQATAGFVLEQSASVTLIVVGRKGQDFMRRHGRDIRAEFTQLGDRPSLLDTLPISRIIIDDYTNGVIDLVYLVYAQFVSTMVQRPVLQQILPVEPAAIPTAQNVGYIYEPGLDAVLGELLPRFVEMNVYHAILDSIASEQSARMVAMRNATDNASELVDELTLIHNKARQELITRELLDITGGAAAALA